jgi:hypothetical protein
MELPTKATDNQPLPQRSRRLAYIGLPIVAIAMPLAMALVIAQGHFARPAHVPEIVLLYVGAEDCAPCRAWQKDDRPGFLASPEFPLIRYHEIKSTRLVDVLKDENWPEELRTYRGQLKPSDGVPLWMIVADDRLVERQFGATAWHEIVLPKLRKLAKAAPQRAM